MKSHPEYPIKHWQALLLITTSANYSLKLEFSRISGLFQARSEHEPMSSSQAKNKQSLSTPATLMVGAVPEPPLQECKSLNSLKPAIKKVKYKFLFRIKANTSVSQTQY